MKLPQEIIRAKRDGGVLPDEDIVAFVDGLMRGAVTPEQASAFAMAVFFRGMSAGEAAALTRAMQRSGMTLDWASKGLDGPVLDKHSTGGVGDNVSLVLAPAVAACGGYVPMISGRGLGHTGGTLDKLSAIPGYRTQPSLEEFQRVVREAGCAIIGQTDDLAPADRRLYAIRDVTATVESIPLITASILSKKLAAGLTGLVMDVKCGSGAFMRTLPEARDLARMIASTGEAAGLPTRAIITGMDAPLASAAGNAVETAHAIAHLTGARHEPRLGEVVEVLGAAMLVLGGLAHTENEGRARIRDAMSSGRAAEHFSRMVAALGGPSDICERPEAHLQKAPIVREIWAVEEGRVQSIDTRAIGLAVIALGGGRRKTDDSIDLSAGFVALAEIGADARAVPLALVHARADSDAEAAAAMIRSAYRIGPDGTDVLPVIIERIAPP